MKRILIASLFYGLASMVSGQNIESGTVKYQRIVDLGIKAEGEWAEFKKTLPKTRTSNFVLYFSKSQSLFVDNPKENEAPSQMMQKAMWFAGSQGQPTVKFVSLYLDLEKKSQVKQTEFMTRLFLEEQKTPMIKWKMGSATKEIIGYTCMQAETEVEGKKVLAWFAPSIPVSVGPDQYHGLPGIILEANFNQGQQIWVAVDIDEMAPSKELLVKPKEGKKVKPEQYRKIQEQKIAEWEKQAQMKKNSGKSDVLKK